MPKKFSGLSSILVQRGSRVAIVPVCDLCKRPILDFEDADVLFECPTNSRAGKVVTIHKSCGPGPRDWGWMPLSAIFKHDQRSNRDRAFEALSNADNGGSPF
jgi:hypothetical protein